MKINSEHPLLLNMQYVEGNKRAKTPDNLYVLWKDLDTGEKHLETIPEPKIDIYFEKPEFRDHTHIRKWQYIDKVNKYTCKYSDIKFAILKEWGEQGNAFWKNICDTKDWAQMRKIDLYPYVYGSDTNITTYYRDAWMKTIGKPKEMNFSRAFLDIETDSFNHPGFTKAETDPVDLVTIIDRDNMKSYTFALVGREYIPRDTSLLNEEAKKHIEADDRVKQAWYERRHKKERYLMEHLDDFKEELHKDFDEKFGELDYQFYFYEDEKKMLVHLFELIHKVSPDFIFIWNISFDVPYLMDRMKALGLDPKEIMCHPDFTSKKCYFRKDRLHFDVKNKTDYFHITDKSIWYDQMILYAAKRKGMAELPSKRLNDIAKEEIDDEKLNYDEYGDIKKFAYLDYWKYVKYNIKDVLLQVGIDDVTEDSRTLYVTSFENFTDYADVWKQMVVLRNVQYHSLLSQGFVPGANENGILASFLPPPDPKKKKKEKGFEGAVVGDPLLIDPFGMKMYGKHTNYLFDKSIDMDMSAYYPNTNYMLNIDAEALIFKVICPAKQFDVLGGDIPFKGITDVQVLPKNTNTWADSPKTDASKEIFDNFQSRNYLATGYKFMNLPSFEEIEMELMGEFGS